MPLIENQQAPGTYMLPLAIPLTMQSRPPLEGILVRAGRWVGSPRGIYKFLKTRQAQGLLNGGGVIFINDKLFIHERPGQVVIIENDNAYKRTINQSWYE